MPKFTPLNLSSDVNATRSNTPLSAGGGAPWQPAAGSLLPTVPSGPQTFWGVPFDLGPAAQPYWIMLGANQQSIELALPSGATASYICIVHLCNSSRDDSVSGPRQPLLNPVMRPGERLADYEIVYADGSVHSQPIRRRFEINEPTAVWGHLAFAARAHWMDAAVDPLGAHPAGQWGRDQTGVYQPSTPGPAAACWVYALANPHPARPLKALRLCATGTDTLAVAAVTLYHGKEHLLRYQRLQTVRVVLPDGEAALPDQIPASIDLGVIARRYAVPAFDPQAWLAAEPKGWGEEAQVAAPTTTVLLDVTAAPDATLRAGAASVQMADVSAGGVVTTAGGARFELLTPHTSWVHVTIIDDSTGKPTPTRVHFRSPDGRYFPPYGHRHVVNDNWFEDYGADLKLGSTQYAYVEGTFQIELPVGRCYAEVSKGFEYEALRQAINIAPGQRTATIHLNRRLNLRRQGWVTADTHVHFISPQTAWLEGQAEGLNLINLLASQWGDLFTNVGDITGDQSGCSRDDTIVWVGTENRQHLLGHMSLLGVKGSPIYPMCASGPSESYLGDPTWTSLCEWADRCRQQEGVVVIPHFPNPYAEVVAGLILGKIDGVELRDFHWPTMNTFAVTEWYRFLNLGYHVSAVGGTDKMSAGMPVGGVRTYAHLGDEEFSFAAWGRAVRAGRTFTTSGPIIDLQVEGKRMGDAISLPAGGGTLEVHADARSVSLFHVLQIVVNGQVVAEEKADAGTMQASVITKTKIGDSSWIAARCMSVLKAWHCWPVHLAAHTSPVYVNVGDKAQFSSSDSTYMLTMLDGGLTWLDTLSIPASPERQATIKGYFQNAQRELERRLHGHSHG